MLNRLALLFLLALGQPVFGQVTTYHYDNFRTGANQSETILNTSNVNVSTFGKLFSLPVDSQIYAQPLYMPNVTIPGQGVHNVVYIATLNNSIYAYDADSASQTSPLWHVNLGPYMPILTCCQTGAIQTQVGILGTPAIDLTSGTLYVVAESYENRVTYFRLHALDITTGADKLPPAVIQGSVPGTSFDSSQGILTFDQIQHWQRPGLLLANGNVYIAFGSHQDNTPYHGWLFSYSETTLQQTGILSFSTAGDYNGVWAGGVAPAADANGNVYVSTGNGPLNANIGGSDYGDSVVKVGTSSSGLSVLDYFSPSTQLADQNNDWDLGSSGPLLIPGTGLGIAGGKDGMLYVFNTSNLGKFNGSTNQTVQNWQATYAYSQNAAGGFWAGNYIYYNSTIYGFGERDFLKTYSFNGLVFNTTATGQGTYQVPSAVSNDPAMAISANGTLPGTGIVWAAYSSVANADGNPYPGILHAFDASNVANELWNSNQNYSRDYSGDWAKWVPPIVTNGKVYLATFDNTVNVYGLLAGGKALMASAGTPQSAVINTPFASALQATLKDANHNPLSGVTVTFTAPGTGASGSFNGQAAATSVTDANGIANAPALTANAQSGAYTVTASAPGASSAIFSLTNLAGPPAGVAASAGTPQSASVSSAFKIALQAVVRDINNNPLGGVSVTFTAPAAGASAAFSGQATATAVTNASGIATAPTLTANSQLGSYTVTAGVAGVAATASFSLTNAVPMAAPPSLVQQASGVNAGNNQNTLTVTLANTPNSNNVLVLFFNQVSVSQTITSISGATWTRLSQNYNTNNGDAEVWVGTSPSSPTITLTGTNYFGGFQPGYAIVTEFAGISPTLDGTAVLTANGNWPVTTGNLNTSNASDLLVTSTLSYNGGGVSSTVSSPWTILAPPAGTNSLSAAYQIVSATGAYSATWTGSGSPQVSTILLALKAAGAVGSISASAGTPQSIAVNTPFATALQARVTSGGQPVVGATVTFTAPSTGAGALFSGSNSATAVSNSSGVATAPALTANGQAGNYTVSASANGFSNSASFALSNTASAPASIAATAGTPQSAALSTSFGTPLQAIVKDSGNNPVSGVTVTFSTPGTGASASFGGSATTTATTNGNGIAVASTLTANAQSGSYTVTASVLGVAAFANFSLSNTSAPPASIVAAAGTPQSTTVGTAFVTSLQATVKDATSNPVNGVTVTFTAPASGAGAAFNGSATASAVTNASGIAVAPALTANAHMGAYSVIASVAGVPAAASFALTNLAGPAASVSATAGTLQSAAVSTAFATALQATVTDAGGNPLSGVTVTFATPAGGASAVFGGSAMATAITNALGVATAPTLTANAQTGSYTVSASVAGVPATAGFALTNSAVVVAPPTSLVQQAYGSNPGNNQNTLTVTLARPPSASNILVLIFDQVSTSQTITSISGASWTRLSQNYNSSNGDSEIWIGVNATSAAITVTGTTYFGGFQPGYAIVAEFAGISPTLDGAAVTGTGYWPVSTGTLNTSNAGDLLITSTLSYNGGGVSATVSSPWTHLAPPPGTNSLSAAYQIGAGAGAYAATWNGSGSPRVSTIILALKAAGGAQGSISASAGTPQSETVSGAFPTALQATLTSGGYPVSGATVTFTAPSTGASATFSGLNSATAVTNNSGIATAPAMTANAQAGSYAVTASAPGVSSAANFALSNIAGPSASIAATAGTPQSTAPNTAFATALQAAVKDSGNNPVGGVTVTFIAPSSAAGASFGGSATAAAITNASGLATAPTLTANAQLGSYAVSASVAGVSATASFALSNATAPPANIAATAGTPQSTPVTAPFPTALQAIVKTAGNTPVSGVTVTFTAPASRASATFAGLAAATAVTNASGIATAPALTAGSQAGPFTVTASVAGVSTAASFSLTNLGGAPASISAAAGTPQSTAVSTSFATALQAAVTDAGNNPASGVTVTFSVPSSGASAAFGGSATATAITNASGLATAPALTANAQTGSYTATASVAGISLPASFSLTNSAASTAASASLVQQAAGVNAGNNQKTLSVTLAKTPSSSNILVLIFDQVSAAQTITSISGATWTLLARNYATNNGDSEIWIGANPTSAGITVTGSTYFGGFQPGYAIVAEFAGVKPVLDGSALFTSSGSWPVTTGTLATSNAGDLLITSALSYNGGGASASIHSPWTLFTPPAGTYSLAAAYQIVGPTGSYSALWNGAGSPRVATIILALK